MATTVHLSLPTSQLRPGDIVLEFGMRVRLPEQEPRTWKGFQGRTVYAWKGQVENLDEVLAEGLVPRAFLCEDRWDGGRWVCELTGAWTVQGNDLAIYAVERAAE
ncbi:hypothetical protein [Microbispora sp. NPDC049633]|uniref:hypothetical protein n=1 Tax=Microbispora sp. NPDC049633 TaxID=3154355 RepID=UPI0034400CDF